MLPLPPPTGPAASVQGAPADGRGHASARLRESGKTLLVPASPSSPVISTSPHPGSPGVALLCPFTA